MSDGALARFVDAQRHHYGAALGELQAGAKRSHWIWFIFPQLIGLGSSPMSIRYGIHDLDEARTYLAHPLLAGRLLACTAALLDHAGQRSAVEILGGIDAAKVRSSLTLFEAAGGDAKFGEAIDAFYAGERDPLTLARLGR